MSLVVLFLLVLLALAMPDLCPQALGLSDNAPNVWVLVTLYLSLRARGYAGVGWGIGLGALLDAISLDPLGTNAFVLGTLAWLFAEGDRSRGRIEGLSRLLFVFVGAVIASWIYLLRVVPFRGGVTVGSFFEVFPAAAWTTVFAMALYPLLDRYHLLDDLCGRRRAFST